MTKFSYQKNIRGEYFPVIDLDISYKKKAIKISTLVDSGATISVFKPQVGQFLGLPIDKGKQIFLGGIGGRIKGYLHELDFKIAGKSILAPIVFSYEYNVSFNLLGREGIFRNFKIIFDEKKYAISLLL